MGSNNFLNCADLVLNEVFTYYKMILYGELATKNKQLMLGLTWSIFMTFFVWIVVIILLVITTSSGNYQYQGFKVCNQPNAYYAAAKVLNMLIFLLLNGIMIGIFWFYRNLRGSQASLNIPGLQIQMQLNLTVVPIIYISTIVFHMVNLAMGLQVTEPSSAGK